MKPNQIWIIGVGVVALIALFTITRTLMFVNDTGYYQVRQDIASGTVSVEARPGPHFRMGATLWQYPEADVFYFSSHDLDGGSNAESEALEVQFNDGSKAKISGVLTYRLPNTEEQRITLHNLKKDYRSVKLNLVRDLVHQALGNTATLMKAEEFYSARRAEFRALAQDQIRDGIYETQAREFRQLDVEGNEFVERTTELKLGADGKPVVHDISPFKTYGFQVVSFVVKGVEFDKTIDELIAKKKEAQQLQVVSRANADKARQDAITAMEQGKAKVEEAKAKELVVKIQAVTEAQKEFEVAVFNRKQAVEDAAAVTVQGEADAKIAHLKVTAGLSPVEKAQFQKDTAIGVARELSNIKLPSMMITGGGANGGHVDPFTAVGLQSLMAIQRQMAGEAAEVHKE